MATKSILKQIVVKSNKSCGMLADALEHSCNKNAKVVEAPKAYTASVDDARKMLGIK